MNKLRSGCFFITVLTLCLLLSLAGRASAADWAANFGGFTGANASTQATTTDAEGNTYIAGNFNGATMTLGSVTLTKIGSQDAFVAKLDPSGAVLWARNFGGSGSTVYGQSIAFDDSGNVYLGGYFQGASLTTPSLTKIGTQDAFAVKLDSTGATVWARNFGGSGAYAYGNSIAVNGSGNVYLGGYLTANLTTPALTKIGTYDAFALKLDSAGSVAWAKNFGGSGAYTFGNGIAADGSGNVYLGGYFSNANLTTPAVTKIGFRDAFVLKLDSSGVTAWAKNFGGSSNTSTYGQCIAIDGSGNVYLGGHFINADLTIPALTKIGDQDAFVFKLDSTGATTWARNFGGSVADTFAQGIAVDGSGNVYLGGYFYNGNLTTPALTKIGNMFGNYDAFALKLDSFGTTTWARNFGGSGAQALGQGIGVDGSGNVYLGGYFNANLTTPTLTKIGTQDAFVFKLDSTGATTWAKNFASTTPGNTYSYATATDASGNAYLAGTFDSATLRLDSVTLTRIGSQDAFVAKLDSSGRVLWAKNFGGSLANAYGQGIAVDGYGNIYLGGYFQTYSLTTPALTKIGNIDAFALKLDSTGATIWAKNFGGSGAYTSGQGIAVDGSGNVYLGGYFQNANLTTPALTKLGNNDAFALKLSSSGATIWAKNFGASGASTIGKSIAVDSSGYVYLGGDFSGANLTTPTVTKIGSQDAFAFKLDGSGTTTWAKNFGGLGVQARGRGIAVDGSGNVYLGGDFQYGNLTTPSLTKIGTQDAFAFKLDSTGATTWAKNYGGIGASAYGWGIAVDGSGNVFLGGEFTGANLTTPDLTKIGSQDAFALKLDSTSTTNWAKNFGGSGAPAYGRGIAVDGSGNLYLVGNFAGANLTTPVLTKIGTSDVFISASRFNNAPTATAGSASSITTTTATLNDTVNDHGDATTVSFEYGVTTGYGSSTPGGTVNAGTGATAVSAAITGLTCGTTYHFRVNASNAAGSVSGIDAAFTTSACISQTIVFENVPTIIVGGTGTVSATGGGSGNPVVFSSQTPSVCTVSGATVTVVSAGACIIAADQAGNASYTPAQQVKQGFINLNGAPPSDWVASFGGLSGMNAYTQATATDASGNTYLAGFFDGASLTLGSVTLTRIGSQDAFVAKLDPSGTVLWARNFGGSYPAYAWGQGIAVDGSGNVYLGGYFSNGNLTTPALPMIGSYDAFVLKLDSSGAIVWAKNFGGSSAAAAYGQSIAVDGSGNVYLGGYFANANLTTPALTKINTIYGMDAFALKLGSNGATVWAKNFGASGASTIGNSIAVDSSGNVYLAGDFSGANLTTPAVTKIGVQDAFAVKLTSTGVTTWARNFGGSGAYAFGKSIAVDSSGNVYLGGYFQTGNLTTPALTRIGTQDAFALKFDSSGATTWAKNFGGSGATTYGQGIAVDGSENVYLVGRFQTANLTTPALTKIGSQDAFAFKLDSTGATTWARNYGGSGANAYGQGIAVDGSGNVYLGGYFNTANLTTPALAKIGINDAFTLKLDSSGATTWAINFAPTTLGDTTAYATATDIAGNTYITGKFSSATLTLGSVTLTRIGTQDAFVVKQDASGTVLWAKNFGGSSVTGLAIAVDISGNVYLGGYFYNGNLTTPALTKIGTQDAFVLKLDSSGATVWAKNFGGSGASAVGYGIAVDSSENVYFGGSFSNGNLTTPALTKIGSQDAFAVKLDSSGTTTWAKNFGGSSGAYAYGQGIAVDTFGNVYLGGYFSSASLTTPLLTRNGTADAFAFKLSSSGTINWAKSFGGSGASVVGNGIAVDGSGNVYLGGHFYNANLTTPALIKIGSRDAFTLKLDNTGVTTWARNFGGSGATVYGQGIAVDGSRNVYLGGYFQTGNLTTPALTRIGAQDAFSLKLNSSGATTWAKNFGGSGATAYGMGIAVDGFANVHLGGYFNGANLTTPPLTKIGNMDTFASVSASISAPTVTTGSASSIATTTATLNGTVNDNGAATTVTFDYGLDTNYGSTVSGGTVTTGSGTTPVSAAISGLTCNTIYHFRVIASNAAGSASGNDATFTTSACLAQTITFGTAPSIVIGGTGTVSATGGGSGNPVVFTSQTPAVCTVNGATVTGVTTGTCTIAADQAGNAGYAAALQVAQNFTISPNTATLTVSFLGNGGGSVNSDPGGIACTSGSSAGCSAIFTVGAPVTLTALADWKSTFSGWGLPCSGTDSCIINLTGDGGIAATFTKIPRVRIPGPTPVDFAALQDAYATVGDGDTLKMKSDTFFENLYLDRAVVVILDGGWDDTFTGIAGQTTLAGTLSIDLGTAIISNLVIQ